MAVFTQSEVADIVGMPKSLLKNWTIGRPLRITPTERTAKGKGSPNLYNRQDIYLVALAYELSQAGLALEKIEEVLAYIKDHLPKSSPNDVPNLSDANWISIELQGQHLAIEILLAGEGSPKPPFYTVRAQNIKKVVSVKYIIKVMTLVQTIDRKISEYE